MPELLDLLYKANAAECWHKCGNFMDHLYHLWRILCLWKQSTAICRLGLYHSVYSNKSVNLALFNWKEDRDLLRNKLGEEAEQLVYLFCSVDRHALIIETIHSGEIPPEGKIVKHHFTGEDIHISQYIIGVFLVVCFADEADQQSSWQEELMGLSTPYSNTIITNSDSGVLWPGIGRPGIWQYWVSYLANKLKRNNIPGVVFPPIFNYCADIIKIEDEIKARDLYWAVITNHRASAEADTAVQMLKEVIVLNPYVGEPHALLAQIFIQKKDFQKAMEHAEKGLKLFQLWGTAWDKRISWEGWISWARVIYNCSQTQTWPSSGEGILNLGLIK